MKTDNDFINVNDFIKEENIYQIQINNNKINIKKIGKSKYSHNIIICENIGKKQDISIYSVVYMLNELNDCEKTGGNYDLLKLYQNNNGNDILSELCININDKYEINDLEIVDDINNFDLYFISQIKNKEKKYIKKIDDKNINKNNILEKLIFEHKQLYNI